MAIEGPLRELGIHDVFQLLDLSRKTGTLAVTSELRDNEGTVLFEKGWVVAATIKSNPHRIGDLLVRSGKVTEAEIAQAGAAQAQGGDRRRLGEILVALGAISPKELEHQVRLQIEAVIFELMSWREGFFRFEEGPVGEEGMLRMSTESLLMEGARRIDEWSRIADRVPSLSVIPELAPVDDAHAPQLDLLPGEWEVLTMIDGEQDLRGIAQGLGRSEFDVAKIVYGLVSTGVVSLRVPSRVSHRVSRMSTPMLGIQSIPELRDDDKTPVIAVPAVTDAPTAVMPAMRIADVSTDAPTAVMSAVRVAEAKTEEMVAARVAEAKTEEIAAVPAAPAKPIADHLERGFDALRRGDLDTAVSAWAQFLQASPSHEMAERVRGGLEAVARLRSMLEARYGD